MIFLPGEFPPRKAAHAVGADQERVTAELSLPAPAGGTEKTEIQDGPACKASMTFRVALPFQGPSETLGYN